MDEDAFQDRLLAGERIAWSGRPQGGILFTPRDLFLIPFSLMWCGFAIFWEWGVNQQPAPFFFRLWGLPFVAMGLYFVAGRFFADAWFRTRIRYAVTNQRILILRLAPFGNFTTLPIGRLPSLSLSEKSDGSGSIQFQETPTFNWAGRNNAGSLTPSLDKTPQFIAIPDARRVFDIIQNLAKAG